MVPVVENLISKVVPRVRLDAIGQNKKAASNDAAFVVKHLIEVEDNLTTSNHIIAYAQRGERVQYPRFCG